MEASFSYSVKGDEKFVFLNDPESKIPDLIEELHNVMQNHTGGCWKKFILSLDEKGKAHTKFIYDEK